MQNKEKESFDYIKHIRNNLSYIEKVALRGNYLSLLNDTREVAYFLIEKINTIPLKQRQKALDICLESETLQNLDKSLTTNKFYKDEYTIEQLLKKHVALETIDESIKQREELEKVMKKLNEDILKVYTNYELSVFVDDLADFNKMLYKRENEFGRF